MQLSDGGTEDDDGGATGHRGPEPYRPGELRVTVHRVGRARVVSVGGELDHDSADGLRTALAGQPEEGLARIVVELSGLSFCDSTGLNILLRARQDAERAGVRLEVAGPPPAVGRLFAVTGADTVLRIHPSLGAALAADGPADPGTGGPGTGGPGTGHEGV
ncbi:STAS domain-containing protein [Kitasatospora sp. NPDC056327]|uniref:STAS domain-containing protein n=1 Tax=Kitasatospora sp. NPDC056327 TaxID=3345785 RepID=UPI0035D5B559